MKSHPLSSPKLLAWLIFLTALGVALAIITRHGYRINTDFLSVFSSDSESKGFYKANALYENHFENELLLFVGHSKFDTAVSASHELGKQMEVSPLFSKVSYLYAQEHQLEWVPFLFQRRKALLTPAQIKKIEGPAAKDLVNQALQNLYSPTGTGSQLATDPFGLFSEFLAKNISQYHLTLKDGFLTAESSGKVAIFLRAHVDRAAPDFNQELVDFVQASKVSFANKGVEVSFLGPTVFSAYGSIESMKEVNLYGTLSLLGIVLLLTWSFGSLIPVLASSFTILISMAAGFVAVALVFDSVHILSILLGISVLGIVTDYCTHFFAKGYDESLNSNQEVMKKIKTALSLGLLTNVLTYLCFVFTDLVVLRQLALFTIAGIFTTYFTVMAVFPLLRFRRLQSAHLAKFVGVFSFWRRVNPWILMTSLSLGLCIGYVITSGVKFDDDIRRLQTVNPALKEDEAKVLSYLGADRSSHYFILLSSSEDGLLQQEETLAKRLRNDLDRGSLSLANFVPSSGQQVQSVSTYARLKPLAKDLFAKIKAPMPATMEQFFAQDQQPYTPQEFLAVAGDLPIRANWLGPIEKDQYYSVLNLTPGASYEELSPLQSDSRMLFSKAHDLSQILQKLRETIMNQFSTVAIFLCIVLALVYRSSKVFLVLFPPLFASMLTLWIAFVCFGNLNLFHILAVILIFCLGLDFSVFFSQSSTNSISTHIGIFISFLSTLGSFGVLGLSQTHAVSSFGSSVALGISLCYFLSPLASRGKSG